MAVERMNDTQKTYRVEDIMQILDIGRNSAYNLVKENHFRWSELGRRFAFPENPSMNGLKVRFEFTENPYPCKVYRIGLQ